MNKLRREVSALIELGILFLPSIPALIWLWPNLKDDRLGLIVQVLVYIYFFSGTLFIGLRRWSWDQLGWNRCGIVLSLICGSVFIIERGLAQLTFGLPLTLNQFGFWRVTGEVLFYFGIVGVVEETLFRGLIYRALEDWKGNALAIIGSSMGFALWHIGWAGPFIVAHLIIGLVFGLIRWRAGGILGLIIIHGLFDLVAVETQVPVSFETIRRIQDIKIANPLAVIVGDALLIGLVIYLWKIHPYLQRRKH